MLILTSLIVTISLTAWTIRDFCNWRRFDRADKFNALVHLALCGIAGLATGLQFGGL